MSFDIFLQDFSADPVDRSRDVVAVLAPWLGARGEVVTTADGSAAVFGVGEVPLTSLMFNHVEGDRVWDVIYELAVVGDWVVLPVGAPCCIVAESQAAELPEELRELGVVMVRSGSDLQRAVMEA